jgi:hypothetical protein
VAAAPEQAARHPRRVKGKRRKNEGDFFFFSADETTLFARFFFDAFLSKNTSRILFSPFSSATMKLSPSGVTVR